jgi:hypothetical protein
MVQRLSGDLIVRATNFMRTERISKDEAIIVFDSKKQVMSLENSQGEIVATLGYNSQRRGTRGPYER